MSDIKASDWLLYGALAVGAYLIYRTLSGVTSAVGAGVSAATGAVSSGVANLWLSLTAAPSMNVLGNIRFPDGSLVPIANMPVRTDASGNVYVNAGGTTYQLMPSDANGNWPAVAVG